MKILGFIISIGLIVLVYFLLYSRHNTDMNQSSITPNNNGNFKRLLIRINQIGDINDPSVPKPLVTLEEFFEGNNDYSSIGYNFYPDQPSPQEFYQLFKEFRAKTEVNDVLVEVNQHENPDMWPSTDTIWIITTASKENVNDWLGERFSPNEILLGFKTHIQLEPYNIPQNYHAIGIWWD